MGFNFPENIQYCKEFVEELSGLILYTHIPSAISALLIGTFVRNRNRSLLAGVLFWISIVFSVWVTSNLLLWIFSYNNGLVMAVWALIETLAVFIYVLFLYFTYIYINKTDPPIWLKILATAPLFGAMMLATTNYNLTEYDIQECVAISTPFYDNFIIVAEIIYSIWIIIFALYHLIKADSSARKQILLLTIGIAIFLLSFLVAGYVSVQTEYYLYEAYGLFGMVIFVGFLGYIIVRFNEFNVKLIAAQFIVAALVFLIASQFLFIQNSVNRILNGVTVILSMGFGYALIKSVKREIEQREKIERLAIELEKANTELKELDRQKDELLGLVSHQLATPVSSIKWYLEMMQDGDLGKLSDEQKEHVKTMTGIGTNLTDLVSMILDVSRIQLGRVHIEKQELNLKEFFKEILDEVEPKAKEKNQKFEVHLPEQWPKAMLDRRYTRMTIENLLTNAIKYTPKKGTVKLTVTIKDGVMHCEVKDTGCGIPKADQDKIFGRMFRASNVRNSVDGNGFGLYIAKGAVEAQGGKIWFESEEGKGTKFSIEVPLQDK